VKTAINHLTWLTLPNKVTRIETCNTINGRGDWQGQYNQTESYRDLLFHL